MRYRTFCDSFLGLRARSAVEALEPGSRYVILGDLRMGDGGIGDELAALRDVVETALASWYLEKGFTLILNGDTENLRDFWLKDIRSAWTGLYAIFDRFASRSALRKILGERDLGLLRKPHYPFPALHGLRLVRENLELFILHGHQASRYFAGRDYRDFLTDYLENPRRIRDDGDTEEPGRINRAERRLYRASLESGIVSIVGHSGHALFESRGAREGLRSRIEQLILDTYAIRGDGADTIDAIIRLYRKSYRESTRSSLDHVRLTNGDDENPAPCLFNSGLAMGRGGMNAIEIEDDRIRQVHWVRAGRLRRSLQESALQIQSLGSSGPLRCLIAETELANVAARVSVAGSAPKGLAARRYRPQSES
jgi:hypothetical protein